MSLAPTTWEVQSNKDPNLHPEGPRPQPEIFPVETFPCGSNVYLYKALSSEPGSGCYENRPPIWIRHTSTLPVMLEPHPIQGRMLGGPPNKEYQVVSFAAVFSDHLHSRIKPD